MVEFIEISSRNFLRVKPEVINSGNGLPLEIFDGTYSVYGSFGFSNGNMEPGTWKKTQVS